jgi:hypothetical protein
MDPTELEEMVRTDLYNTFQCLGWNDQDAENIIEDIEIPWYVLNSYEIDRITAAGDAAYDSYMDK